MNAVLIDAVWKRAGGRCEYCQIEQRFEELTFHIDHIIARKHQGKSVLSNLALACVSCSLAKGPNIAGRDPLTDHLTPLLHPRRDTWSEHFRWKGSRLIGLTPIGRTTVLILNINESPRIAIRDLLRRRKQFPPLATPHS